MLRRCLTTFVLLGYLAGQLAVVPHAHAGKASQHKNGWQPHVHLTKADGNRDHHHDHDHDGGRGHAHRHHDHDHAAHPNGCDEVERGAVLSSHSDHDADAVYVTAVDAAVPRNDQSSGADPEVAYLAVPVNALTSVDALLMAKAIAAHAFLGGPAPPCALYLTLRTLRI